MKPPIPPFYNVNDELLYTLLTGGNCLHYEQLQLDNTAVVSLNIPIGALYALIVVEADPTTLDKSRVARFVESLNYSQPTAIIGIPVGDLSVLEVKGRQNMENFRIVGIEPNKIHSMKIQFYG